jgi:hypothetical protein
VKTARAAQPSPRSRPVLNAKASCSCFLHAMRLNVASASIRLRVLSRRHQEPEGAFGNSEPFGHSRPVLLVGLQEVTDLPELDLAGDTAHGTNDALELAGALDGIRAAGAHSWSAHLKRLARPTSIAAALRADPRPSGAPQTADPSATFTGNTVPCRAAVKSYPD